MSEHKRHVYRVRDLESGGVMVVARPPGVDQKGGHHASRDEALGVARSVQDWEKVRVSTCSCGADALSRYVEEHPRSIVAARVVVFEGGGEGEGA